MIPVFLIIHLILAVTIVGLVLIQRSEGGGLGLGSGGGGLGNLATAQTTANVLTRMTWICVGCFFATSLILGVLYNNVSSKRDILAQLDKPVAAATAGAAAPAVDEASKSKTETVKADEKAKPDTHPKKPSKDSPAPEKK